MTKPSISTLYISVISTVVTHRHDTVTIFVAALCFQGFDFRFCREADIFDTYYTIIVQTKQDVFVYTSF
jgi:hypothetical protein